MPDYEKIAEQVRVGEPSLSVSRKKIEEDVKAARPQLVFPKEKYEGIATAKGYAQKPQRIRKVRYNHEAMIDVIIAEPKITQRELAAKFEVSEAWISMIYGSDSFQAALARRRDELLDPDIIFELENRLKGLAHLSLNVITEKLEESRNTELALKGLDTAVKALGFGARAPSGNVNNQFVIQLPPKAENSQDWIEQAAPMKKIGSG